MVRQSVLKFMTNMANCTHPAAAAAPYVVPATAGMATLVAVAG